jgi:hypothetical protein
LPVPRVIASSPASILLAFLLAIARLAVRQDASHISISHFWDENASLGSCDRPASWLAGAHDDGDETMVKMCGCPPLELGAKRPSPRSSILSAAVVAAHRLFAIAAPTGEA